MKSTVLLFLILPVSLLANNLDLGKSGKSKYLRSVKPIPLKSVSGIDACQAIRVPDSYKGKVYREYEAERDYLFKLANSIFRNGQDNRNKLSGMLGCLTGKKKGFYQLSDSACSCFKNTRKGKAEACKGEGSINSNVKDLVDAYRKYRLGVLAKQGKKLQFKNGRVSFSGGRKATGPDELMLKKYAASLSEYASARLPARCKGSIGISEADGRVSLNSNSSDCRNQEKILIRNIVSEAIARKNPEIQSFGKNLNKVYSGWMQQVNAQQSATLLNSASTSQQTLSTMSGVLSSYGESIGGLLKSIEKNVIAVDKSLLNAERNFGGLSKEKYELLARQYGKFLNQDKSVVKVADRKRSKSQFLLDNDGNFIKDARGEKISVADFRAMKDRIQQKRMKAIDSATNERVNHLGLLAAAYAETHSINNFIASLPSQDEQIKACSYVDFLRNKYDPFWEVLGRDLGLAGVGLGAGYGVKKLCQKLKSKAAGYKGLKKIIGSAGHVPELLCGAAGLLGIEGIPLAGGLYLDTKLITSEVKKCADQFAQNERDAHKLQKCLDDIDMEKMALYLGYGAAFAPYLGKAVSKAVGKIRQQALPKGELKSMSNSRTMKWVPRGTEKALAKKIDQLPRDQRDAYRTLLNRADHMRRRADHGAITSLPTSVVDDQMQTANRLLLSNPKNAKKVLSQLDGELQKIAGVQPVSGSPKHQLEVKKFGQMARARKEFMKANKKHGKELNVLRTKLAEDLMLNGGEAHNFVKLKEELTDLARLRRKKGANSAEYRQKYNYLKQLDSVRSKIIASEGGDLGQKYKNFLAKKNLNPTDRKKLEKAYGCIFGSKKGKLKAELPSSEERSNYIATCPYSGEGEGHDS